MNCAYNRRNETFSFLVHWKPINDERLFSTWETQDSL